MSQKNRKTKVGATNQQYPLIQKKKNNWNEKQDKQKNILETIGISVKQDIT